MPNRWAANVSSRKLVLRSFQLIPVGLAAFGLLVSYANGVAAASDPIAKFLALYKAGRLLEAAELLHCPEDYTPAERKLDQAAVAGSLAIFTREFGQVETATESDSNLYVVAFTACGTTPYWKEHPDISSQTYKTVNASGDEGYIIFSFASVNGQKVLSKFKQGLPVSLGAIARVKRVFKLQMEK